jgi:hypothetical protein
VVPEIQPDKVGLLEPGPQALPIDCKTKPNREEPVGSPRHPLDRGDATNARALRGARYEWMSD